MKKILLVLIFVGASFFLLEAKNEVVIPEESIRFRVIANSDEDRDQLVKELVSREVQKEISRTLENVSSVSDARTILSSHVPQFREVVQDTLLENHIDTTFQVHYGMNYFPEKIYKGVTYKEGEYESLVVTLGNGFGKNWWCVLFPPICLLEAEETNASNEVEYRFFIQELLDKYF